MSPEEIHAGLMELAKDAGFEVRRASGRAGADLDLPIASGVCRVRGAVWVVLAANDSQEERIAVLAAALKTHAAAFLESRYVPPALRDRLGV